MTDNSQDQPDVPALATRLSVVLVVDLVESVQAMEFDERGVIARWQTFVERVRHDILPARAGRLVKSLGDGLLAEFSDAAQAVGAARAMHEWFAASCAPLADGRRLALRAGLHEARVFDAEIDLYGSGVNVAARVAQLAAPGELVATVEVRDQLHDSLDADVEDLGECHLKHVARPVRVYRLGEATQAASLPARSAYAAELHVGVAVIPFNEVLVGPSFAGLGDVVADGMIDQLSQSPGLRVVSRLSTACLRHRELPLAEMAARLGVRYLVSGHYVVNGDRVSIAAELADATNDQVVWSGRSQGPWGDLLCAQSELIHELADAVHRTIQEGAVARATVQPLPVLTSCELLLAGVAMMYRAGSADFATSRSLLEHLTERHRRIALPHAWLGKWHVLRSIQGTVEDPAQAADEALQHTGRALDLEPHSAFALAIEGFVYCHLKKDLATAELRLRDACVRNPSLGFAWLFLAVIHTFRGESAPALTAAHRSLALSPVDPLRYYYESLVGSCEYGSGHHAEAIAWSEASHRRNRHHLSTLRILIAAHAAMGQGAQARHVAAELRALRPDYTVAAYEEHSVAVLFPFGQGIARAMREAGIP